MALLIIPLIGLLGVAGETTSWFTMNRSMQNAADSAALAAAMNGDTTTVNGGVYAYQREALEVAGNYGFTSGSNNVTVTAASGLACPDGVHNNCFQVTIQQPVHLYLAQIVGFRGSTTIGGAPAQLIKASAMAQPGAGAAAPFCILALGAPGVTQDLLVNGGPNSNMNGCYVASNGSATCHGHAIGGTDGSYAISGTNDCAANGNDQTLSQAIADPYASKASSIPSNPCPNPNLATSYAQEPQSKKDPALPAANQLSGTYSANKFVCGDAQLTGNVTLNAGDNLIIENGVLDNNGFTLTNNGGTIFFTGPNITGFSPQHIPTGGGTLTLTSPASGTFADIAIFTDPAETTGVDISSAGNSPTWNIQGVVYSPNSNITISGAVNKDATNSCIGFIVATLRINGTGDIIDNAGCSLLTVPGVTTGGGTRVALVQ